MPKSLSNGRVIRFGVFEADVRSGELRKSGVKIRLREQAFQVLAALLERPGEVVTREELRDRLWPDGTFVDFDHSLNAAVNRIREVLGDSATSPRFVETLPRRGYRFVAPVEKPGMQPGPRRRFSARQVAWVVSLIALVALAATSYRFVNGREQLVQPALKKTYLTSYPGHEIQPSFSPDASQVAFAWGDEQGEDFDIYIKLIGVEPPRRITNDPLPEFNPVWSPDGRWIAFLRRLDESRSQVVVVDPFGNRERKLTEISSAASFRSRYLAWSSDAKGLVVVDKRPPAEIESLYWLSVDTAEKRQLTAPPLHTFLESNPVVSTDGRRLAFSRFRAKNVGDLYVLDLLGDRSQKVEPQRLTFHDGPVQVAGWEPDGKNVIYSLRENVHRIQVSGSGETESVAVLGPVGISPAPALSREGKRLVYGEEFWDTAVMRLEFPKGAGKPVLTKLVDSTRWDLHGEYSPDGSQIAFVSNRSGNSEVWLCDRDGSKPVQLTSVSGRYCGHVRWSPEGRRILFNLAGGDAATDIWIARSEGGAAEPLISGPSVDVQANWSRNGDWIYFTSNRTGQFDVWKMKATGGNPQRVTSTGGANAIESVDGKWLFYVKEQFPQWETSLWKVPVEGGHEVKVLEPLMRNYVVVEEGIYFISQTHESVLPDPSDAYLQFYRFESGETEVIAKVKLGWKDQGLSVSPDGRSFLFTDQIRAGSDLVMLEGF